MNFKLFEALSAMTPLSKKDIERLAMLKQFPHEWGLHYQGTKLHINTKSYPTWITLDTKNKEIKLPEGYESNPYWVSFIEMLYKTSLFNDYKVENSNLYEIVKKIKQVSGKYPSFANQRAEHRSSLKQFGIKIIKEIWEHPWYHVTFKKYLNKIKSIGIQPSKTIDDIMKEKGYTNGIPLGELEQRGWSNSYNPHKQNAVYLYSNLNNAEELAEYLNRRNNEPSVVLQIDGHAIKDYSKLVLDEDVMRDFDGIIGQSLKIRIPHFYQSFLHMNSIGYLGVIPLGYIKVIKEYNTKYDDEY